MPHVAAAKGQGRVPLDNGFDAFEGGFFNVDVTLPMAAAALAAGRIVQLDNATPPLLQSPGIGQAGGPAGPLETGAAIPVRQAPRRRAIPSGKVVITARNVCQRPNLTAGMGGFTHHQSRLVYTSATDLVFRFMHVSMAAVKEAVAAGSFTLRASVRVNGQNHEITRNGNRDIAIATGYVDSDPVSVSVNAGDTLLVSTFLVSGQLPYSTSWADATAVSTYGDSYSAGDVTGPTGAVGSGTSAHIFGPALIFGTPKAGATIKPVVAIGIDSVGRGFGDTTSYGADGGGYIARALDPAALPWVNVSRASSALNDWTDLYGRKIRASMVADCDYAVINGGGNDLNAQGRTALQTETSLVSVAKTLFADRGVAVYVCTITPITSSTDSWATLGNQTVTVGQPRTDYNDWIRAGCPINSAASLTPVAIGTQGALLAGQPGHPIKGYFGIADTVESSRDSGKWKVDGSANTYTADGIHPTSTGHIAMAAAIDTSKFT